MVADKPVLVPGVYRPQLKVRGLGLEGDAAAEEVLLLILKERPNNPEQLLAGNKAAALVQLAALSESLDYVADRMMKLGGLQGGLASQGRRRVGLGKGGHQRGGGGHGGVVAEGLADALALLVDR